MIAQDDEVTFNFFYGLKHSNTGKDCLRTCATKEAFPETKEQLDLSNILEKVIHHCTSQVVEKKKELLPKFVEKQVNTNKLSTSCVKEVLNQV